MPEWDGVAPLTDAAGGTVEYSVTKQSQGYDVGIIGP